MESRARRHLAQTFSGPKATRTREVLIEAARELFLERGYVGTGVDDIAELAAVSRPTFYTYFRSKREILKAVALIASDAATPVIDALGDLGPAWTSTDVADWVRSYFSYQQAHGPWVLVWRDAVAFDPQLVQASQSTRRHHARRIGKHLHNLGARAETDPVYDGLMVLALLDTLLTEELRSEGSNPMLIDIAASAIEALIHRP